MRHPPLLLSVLTPPVSVGALLYVLAFALLGFTKVYALVPILIASCALGCNVIPYIGSIPLLVNDPTLMGTAYGLWSTFIACNNVILEVACGAIQDATPGGGYERVMYVLITIKGWQAVEGLVLDVLDGKLLGHVLRRSEKQRVALRDEMGKRGEEFVGWRVIRPVTMFFGGQYVVMVIVSWVVSTGVVSGVPQADDALSSSSSTRSRDEIRRRQ